MTAEPACKGKELLSEHPLIELGRCPHEVGGATYTYLEFGCPDCGVTARKTVIFACGTRAPRVQPTVDNCVALKWKAARAASTESNS